MASSVNLGSPLWTDGSAYSGLLLRQFWSATKLYDQGTGSAVSAPGGVYPGGGQLQVTPGTGMAVNVAAGYCAVPNATAGHGAYIFGMLTSGTLTVPSNATGSTRLDYVIANVQDLATSGSYCQIEYVTGTTSVPAVPAVSIILAEISVANGASSISSGNITDLRAYVAPPGCVVPIANAAAAPAVQATTPLYDVATGTLCTGTGTAGTIAPAGFIQVAGAQVINTSAGAQGLNPGNPPSGPWGIGYGQAQYGGWNTDGTFAVEMQLLFTADGVSDYEIYYKWQLGIPVQAWYYAYSGTVTGAGLELQLQVDSSQVDATYLVCGDSPLVTSGGGSASWYTSAALGTTLPAGLHLASLLVGTSGSYAYPYSGSLIGDVHTSGGTVFGAGSTYLNALTQENCILRVMAVPAA
jgi:hypothetical protein